jgi:hypothetical protein
MSTAPDNIGRIGPDIAQLRLRIDAAADWAREKIAATRSPCARDLTWYLIQLADCGDDQLPRNVKTAEALWRAAMEVERLDAWGEE